MSLQDAMLRKLLNDKVLSEEEMLVSISLSLKSLIGQFIAVDIVNNLNRMKY